VCIGAPRNRVDDRPPGPLVVAGLRPCSRRSGVGALVCAREWSQRARPALHRPDEPGLWLRDFPGEPWASLGLCLLTAPAPR
jgi:hypothetical protein